MKSMLNLKTIVKVLAAVSFVGGMSFAWGDCSGNQTCNAINEVFLSTDFTTLGSAGVSLHEWDETEYLPQPWIQLFEQGHPSTHSSAGIVNNQVRASNIDSLPEDQQGTDGIISVFEEGHTQLPQLGGVIYNTQVQGKDGKPLVSLICGYGGDAADDQNLPCGCPDTDAFKKACTGFIPGQDICPWPTYKPPAAADMDWLNCANQCHNCDGSCTEQEGENKDSGGTCAFMPGDNMIKYVMDSSIYQCSKSQKGQPCYNEILVKSDEWITPDSEYDYNNPKYFPDIIWAFSYVKQYPGQSQPDSTPPGVWQEFTTKAWHNFNLMYPKNKVPLLELDVTADKSTDPFSIVCKADALDHETTTTDKCSRALAMAGITGDIQCPDDNKMTSSIEGDGTTGKVALCLCPNGEPNTTSPNRGNSCGA
jgi:hypothetical protein